MAIRAGLAFISNVLRLVEGLQMAALGATFVRAEVRNVTGTGASQVRRNMSAEEWIPRVGRRLRRLTS